MTRPLKIDNLIRQQVQAADPQGHAHIRHFQMGLTWSTCRVVRGATETLGLAMSPMERTRLLAWPGTIAGQPVQNLLPRLSSWNPFDTTLALSACNAVINSPANPLMADAQLIPPTAQPNLAVFAWFRPQLTGKKVVVIGRYPQLDQVLKGLDYVVLERQPQTDDLPDTAAETVIPEADWVFITATSLINKTFTRLAELSRHAVSVLIGPSTPWLPQFADFGIDYLAGVHLHDLDIAQQIAAEGGGVRLFEGGVRYAVAELFANHHGRPDR